jgi:hypothetical protein
MKDDERSSLRLEALEGTVKEVTVDHRRRIVRNRRRDDGVDRDLVAMTSQAASLVDACSGEEASQPGVEPFRVPERGQFAPRPDEGVLDRVGRLLGVPEDEPGDRVQMRDRGTDELGEGVMIARPCPYHEVSLHHAPSRWRDRCGRAPDYDGAKHV